ncbi:MAG TPA: tetratricopeptide repeat protein [Pyrinomonadaceae bacterium]|nr:tetratricopeptide repeat protein [Pyrinomonadaceae bacterium]
MLKKIAVLLAAVGLIAIAIFGVRSVFRKEITKVSVEQPSKADQRIVRAQQLIERTPNAEAYNQLAAAYMQKARETSDFSFNAHASEAINQSLAIENDNYDALKLRAKLELTYHRFAEALETARRAQNFRNDDHDVWGQITDALVELGDYKGAVEAAQRMADLRPDSSAYARVSYLRSLHGDTEGAIEAMNLAVKSADPNDPEGVAWCHVQLGNELLNAGRPEAAERQFDEALQIFPNHRLAIEGKGRAKIASGNFQEAIAIYEREQAKNPSADTAAVLGDLYTKFGKTDLAKSQYEQFERLERDNAELERSWRHMINFWLDHDRNLVDSLTLANREYEARKDIFTCDTLAWALFKTGKVQEAKTLIDEALRTGTKDARINFHAGVIYKSLNLRAKAVQHLRLGAAINSAFSLAQAESAKQMMGDLIIQ